MDIKTIKKMNQITKKIEKKYNEMISLKNSFNKKNEELKKLNEELKNLQKQLENIN